MAYQFPNEDDVGFVNPGHIITRQQMNTRTLHSFAPNVDDKLFDVGQNNNPVPLTVMAYEDGVIMCYEDGIVMRYEA